MAEQIMRPVQRMANAAPRDFTRITDSEEGESRDDLEMVDPVEEEEKSKRDEDSDDDDQVTETKTARSEQGKERVFHYEIYDRLVKLMSKQGAYTHEPPDHGIDSMDITSFHPDQRDWSSARPHRAPVLNLWSEVPGSAPNYRISYLLFNGQLVLDYKGTPIRAFRNLPLTISSAVGGFRLETWTRQDIQRLHIDDILARLRTRRTPNGPKPLKRNVDLRDRANDFRLRSGLISFRGLKTADRDAPRAYLDSRRTPAQKASNQAADRDLTKDEFDTVKKLGRKGPRNVATGSSANQSPRIPTAATSPSIVPAIIFAPPYRLTHPHPPSPAPPNTSKIPTPAPTAPDSRDDLPKTCKEYFFLEEALSETVQRFIKLTGQNPMSTVTTRSYASQWNALQVQFAAIWKSQRPAEETPSLFKLGRWTGGLAHWEDGWPTQVSGAENVEVDPQLLNYMDATAEGGAYVGQDGK